MPAKYRGLRLLKHAAFTIKVAVARALRCAPTAVATNGYDGIDAGGGARSSSSNSGKAAMAALALSKGLTGSQHQGAKPASALTAGTGGAAASTLPAIAEADEEAAAGRDGGEEMVSDLPFRMHYLKLLLLWLPCQVTIVLLLLDIVTGLLGGCCVLCRCYHSLPRRCANYCILQTPSLPAPA